MIAWLLLTSHTPPGGPAGPASGTSALRSVPPYYIALAGQPDTPEHAVIRASATGAVLATVKPPRPYRSFTFVSGAADDRTFVLAAQRWWNVTSGTPGATRSSGTTPRRRVLRDCGSTSDPNLKLARLSHVANRGGPARRHRGLPRRLPAALALHTAEIKIVSLATGSSQRRTWPGTTPSSGTWVGNTKPNGQPLSWAADGRILAFQFWTQSGASRRYACSTPAHRAAACARPGPP